MTVWLFRRTEPQLWTVGFYDPAGRWHPEEDYDSKDGAADRVHYLNGGGLTEDQVDERIGEALRDLQYGGYLPI